MKTSDEDSSDSGTSFDITDFEEDEEGYREFIKVNFKNKILISETKIEKDIEEFDLMDDDTVEDDDSAKHGPANFESLSV